MAAWDQEDAQDGVGEDILEGSTEGRPAAVGRAVPVAIPVARRAQEVPILALQNQVNPFFANKNKGNPLQTCKNLPGRWLQVSHRSLSFIRALRPARSTSRSLVAGPALLEVPAMFSDADAIISSSI